MSNTLSAITLTLAVNHCQFLIRQMRDVLTPDTLTQLQQIAKYNIRFTLSTNELASIIVNLEQLKNKLERPEDEQVCNDLLEILNAYQKQLDFMQSC